VRWIATAVALLIAPRVASAQEGPEAQGSRAVPEYVLERVELRGNGRTDDDVLLRHVPYRAGDRLVPTDPELELVRYRLLSTGFFARAEVKLERGTSRGRVVLVVEVVERNTLIVENLWVGVAADEGDEGGAEPVSPFLGMRIAERNLLGTGVTLGGGVALADNQISLRADFADPTFLGSDYAYARVEGLAQRWLPLPLGHVIRLQGFVGAISGDAPFFEHYYVGDFTDLLPDRVLELAPDRRKAPNHFGTAIGLARYGEFAAKVDVEYRIPLYQGRGSILGVDFFAGAGLYALATQRELDDPAPEFRGAAAIPVDLTYNLGLRVDTSVGGATIAFSNLLGLLPARGSDP